MQGAMLFNVCLQRLRQYIPKIPLFNKEGGKKFASANEIHGWCNGHVELANHKHNNKPIHV